MDTTTTPTSTPAKRQIKRHWLQMGAELEGGWDTKSRTELCVGVSGSKVQHDGSVKVRGALDLGEITTAPHTSLDSLIKDIDALHPERVNNTCGFHLHTSHTAMDYSLLCAPEFWEYYRARWKLWGEKMKTEMTREESARFWERYEGRNPGERQYCLAKFDPVNQLNLNDGTDYRTKRYTQLNFTAYHKYKTLEIRMLPMFAQKQLTILATREWADILDTFLSEFNFPTLNFEREITEKDEVFEESHTVNLGSLTPWEENNATHEYKPVPVGNDILYHIPGAEQYMRPWALELQEVAP